MEVQWWWTLRNPENRPGDEQCTLVSKDAFGDAHIGE